MQYELLKQRSVQFMASFARVASQHESTPREKYDVILAADEVTNIAPNNEEVVEYGEYPQSLVDEDTRLSLEKVFAQRNNPNPQIQETGKKYTIMYPHTKLKEYKEYMFEGRKFVRVTPLVNMNVQMHELKARVPVWCEVEPIKWARNKNGDYVAESMLFTGRMPDPQHPSYVSEEEWKPKFDRWFKEYFSKEFLKWGMVAVDALENALHKRKRRGYEVTVDETPMSVSEQIAFYIKTGKSFMLHGPSGTGKTRRIHDIDPDFTAVPFVKGCLPEQIVGKVCYPSGQVLSPLDKGGNAVDLPSGGVWMPPEWYVDICKKCAEEPDKMHVVFIDEVTNGSESSQSLLFQIVERKSVTGSHGKLPKNSVVVLAGNNKEESSAAYNMPEPLYRRAHGHIYLKPDVADWLEWGSEKSTSHPNEEGRLNIHPLVSAFVATYGKDCFYTEFDEENPNYTMDPRGWEQVSDIIYDNGGVIRRELLESKMGKEFAATFFEFAKNPPITAEEVLSGDVEGLPIPQRPDEKLALIYGLRHVGDRDVGKVRSFINRNLGRESCAVFDKIWCDGDIKRVGFLARLDNDKSNRNGR